MGFALIFVGLLLTVASVRGTQSQLFALVKSDFTGQGNFSLWVVAIMIIGALGYIPALKTLSRWFLALVIVSILLAKGNPSGIGGGFFSQFFGGINKATSAANASLKAPDGITPVIPAVGQLPTLPTLSTETVSV